MHTAYTMLCLFHEDIVLNQLEWNGTWWDRECTWKRVSVAKPTSREKKTPNGKNLFSNTLCDMRERNAIYISWKLFIKLIPNGFKTTWTHSKNIQRISRKCTTNSYITCITYRYKYNGGEGGRWKRKHVRNSSCTQPPSLQPDGFLHFPKPATHNPLFALLWCRCKYVWSNALKSPQNRNRSNTK